MKAYTQGVYVDVATADGEIVSKNAKFQISPISDLPMDLDQVVTRDDKQLQTVGHHWPLSSPLPRETRDRMEQVGTCIVCHREIPAASFKTVHQRDFHKQVMERIWPHVQPFHSDRKGPMPPAEKTGQ
jgi:hypothetical protein